MFRLPLAQRIVAAARRVSERAASSASVSLTFQTRPQPAWLAARRLSALKFTNVRFARSFAAAADASPNAKQEPAADKPSEEEQRMRDERKEDDDIFKQQPSRPAADPSSFGAGGHFLRRWQNPILFSAFFAYFLYFVFKDGSEAIGELMEAYTYDAESTEVSKQWQRKVARHELASFYLLFMSQSIENRKVMIEHGACLVDMCSSDDVERTRIVTKLITAISEADTLREPLLARWPALNAGIIKLAAHADRETAMFANMALTLLVQPAANKVSLKDAGLLDFLRTATKSTDMELVAYAANIMANWAFELPAATIKFTPEQKDMLKNSLMQMAEMFVSTGLHEAALLALQELQKLEPNQAFWHNLLGKVLSTLHRYDEANAHFRDCIRLNPQILEAHHLLAQNLSRSSSSPADQAEAVTVARRCLESADAYPSLPDVHVLLVDTLHSAGQYRAAVQAAEAGCRDVRVKKGSAPYGRLLLLKGRAMFRLGDVVGAEKTLTEASKLLGADARTLYHLAHVLEHQKRHDDALSHVEEALRLNPELAAAHFLKGRVHSEKRQWTEAAASFTEFTKLKPNAPEGWFQLSQVQPHLTGNVDAQFESMTNAVRAWLRVCRASGGQGACARYFTQHPGDYRAVLTARAMSQEPSAKNSERGRELTGAVDELISNCS